MTHLKRKALALTLVLALLFSAVAGAQLSLLAKANFIFPPGNPIITMLSPTNSTYNVTTLSLKVTFETYHTAFEAPLVSNKTRVFSYALDGKNWDPLTITTARDEGYPGGDVFFESSDILPDLTEGSHNLTVRIVSDYFQEPADRFHTESESTVYFRIDTVPQNISIIMPENSTYMLGVPLQFFIDEPASWIGYSLDGQENVTITGNMMLPLPSVGQHTLTLYAKDAYGNPVTSGTVTFIVADPLPILLAVIAVSASAIGLLVYFKKRKH